MGTTFAANTTIKSAEVNANFLEKQARTFTTTVTAAGTTTLVVSDNYYQFFTGATTQNVTLPVASTMVTGYGFELRNLSSGAVTLNSSGANLVQLLAPNSKCRVICVLASGTSAASWSVEYGSLFATDYDFTTQATAAGTTTLLSSSTFLQVFTGATTQTVLLPVTSTLNTGFSFFIINNSSGVVTVQSSGANNVQAMAANTCLEVICVLASGTTAASWQGVYSTLAGNVMTTAGDIVIGGTAGVPTRLAGAAGVLQGAAGSGPSYTQAPTLTTPSMTTPVVSTALNLTGGIINFPATQVPSAGANDLDDYEEGSFTPTLLGISTAGTPTYTVQVGRYTKIGNRVFYSLYVSVSAHTGTGGSRIGGFPFTSQNTANLQQSQTVYGSSYAYAGQQLQVLMGPNSVIVDLYQTAITSGIDSLVPIDGVGGVIITGHYII